MNSRVNEAANRKRNGYNCAQAVACTYCDLAEIDEDTTQLQCSEEKENNGKVICATVI